MQKLEPSCSTAQELNDVRAVLSTTSDFHCLMLRAATLQATAPFTTRNQGPLSPVAPLAPDRDKPNNLKPPAGPLDTVGGWCSRSPGSVEVGACSRPIGDYNAHLMLSP